MSNITISVSGNASTSVSPTWRYWKDENIYYREGIRSDAMVRDKYKTGGDLTLFLTGVGVQDTDYILVGSES